MTEVPDDEDREFVRRVFGTDDIPADVVPGEGLTVEALRHQNDATGTYRQITVPGEVIEDADGVIIGMEPARTETVYVGGTSIFQRDADRLGIDPADFPNIKITPNPEEPTP